MKPPTEIDSERVAGCPPRPCSAWVVADEEKRPLMLGHYNDTPRAGVLVAGDTATGFRNMRQAKRAIERSANYAKRENLKWWCPDRWTITRVDIFQPNAESIHPESKP